MKKKRYLVIACLFAAVFIVSAVMIGVTLYRYQKADRIYSDLQDRFVTLVEQPSTQPTDGAGLQLSEQQPAKPVVTAPIRVDFDALLRENSDVVGWIYCENTPINYPVVRSGDNDQYLRRDLYGKYLISGTLFVDYRCLTVGTGQNFIVYGHNMNNGTMFGTLVNYKEQDYYTAHPVLWYLTPDGDYKIELFAGMVTASDSEVYTPEFGKKENYAAFLQNVRAESTFTSDVSVTEEDSIVTLSTCSYEFGNARYVVFGKLVSLSDPD